MLKDNSLQAVFNEAYASLNTAQRQAVDNIEGPVMVIAGPGTGKTQILTLRIANILLQTDTAPESILALTFTESGAKAMRERLHRYIGTRAYQVSIYTFHGFASSLIKDYPDSYNRIIGGEPASDLEKISIIESILDSKEIKLLRPSGNITYYVNPILKMLGELKKEYITPDELAKIILHQEEQLLSMEKIHEKGAHKGKVRGEYTKLEKIISKNQELLFVYQRYEALLRTQKLYDFEDMIGETVFALTQNESMLRDLQEQYQYILADEHQDVNGSQNHLLELLCSYHDQPNIFVVGDEKQAIYRFQGASLNNFLYFQDRFSETKIISLIENYRSGQIILDTAHSLVKVEDEVLQKLRLPLVSMTVSKSQVTKRIFSHQAVEDAWLVEQVSDCLVKGVSPEEIAVIVRTNREVEALSTNLRKSGITTEASADGDILNHPITESIESLISAVFTDQTESALFTVLHGAYWGLSINDVFKITSARRHDITLFSLLNDEVKLTEIGVSSVAQAKNISTVITKARELELYEAPHRVLEFLLQASGFLDYVITRSPLEGARVVRRLYDEIEALVCRDGAVTLSAVRDMLARRRAYGLPLIAPYINNNTRSVQVMTAHKAKGLEFEIVFIPHLQDDNWGGGNKRNYFTIPITPKLEEGVVNSLDDERRLLYVAMTRAKRELNLSSAETNSEGKALIITRLYDTLDQTIITNCPTDKEEEKFNPITLLGQPLPERIIDKSLITNLFAKRGFSATSFNNYLHNPWDFIYRNILRLPETQSLSMQFGTVVHNVLEFVTKYHTRSGSFPTATEIKSKLEQGLGLLPLSKKDFVRLHEKGLFVLYPYIDQLEKTLPVNTKEEFNLRVVLTTGIKELPELILTGKLDRLDLTSDGRTYRVVDYKTGKPKTRNVIEGKTASSDGNYKRQLVFYALLLSLYDDERYLCREGVLSFVETDTKGLFHEETFSITTEEIESLKRELISAVKEIVAGDFLSNKELADKSSYAHLIRLLNE